MVAKSNSVFIRFFISYVVILFIPITIGSYAYWEAIKVVEQDASDLNMAVLEQGRDVVDGYLNEINSTARQMALNLRTNKVMYISKSVKTTDIYTIMELQKMLSSYILTNDFLKYYYIYFKNGDIIITPDTFYSSPKTFYNHYFPQNDLDYKDWHANLSNTFYYQTFVPGVNAYINKREVPSVLYLQSIPLTGLIPNGYISILIPEKAIEKSLSPIYSKGGGWFYVIDENEKVVTSALPDTESIQEINLKSIEEGKSSVVKIRGQKMVVSYSVSKVNNWKYVAVMPYSVVMSKVEHIKIVSMAITFIILVAGGIASFIIAYQNNRPFRKLMEKIISKKGIDKLKGKSSLAAIENAIDMLVNDNEQLQQLLKQQIPMIKHSFYERLIKGDYTSLSEIKSIQHVVNVNINGAYYNVMLIRIEGYYTSITPEIFEEKQKRKVVVKQIIETCLSNNITLHDVESDKVMLLFSFKGEKKAVLKDTINSLAEEIQMKLEKYNIKVGIGIGEFCKNLLYVHNSFVEAKQALEYSLIKKHNTLWFEDISVEEGCYYFPLEIQMKVLSFAKAGEKEEIQNIMTSLYKENFTTRKLSMSMIKQFLIEIRGIILKLLNQLTVELSQNEEIMKDIHQMDRNPEDTFKKFVNTLTSICELVESNKKSHNILLSKDIINYIKNNYMDIQISLSSVAAKFGMNEAYLSYFFKEQSGENFSTFLEKVRITKACELLEQERNIQVKEIASMVGYGSDVSFRRAFKRMKCVSPSKYRSNAQGT